MNTNQQVRGTYKGHTFSGTITEMRLITTPGDGCFEYMVALDVPITVFGTERTHLGPCAKFDGSPSSHTRYTDELIAVQ